MSQQLDILLGLDEQLLIVPDTALLGRPVAVGTYEDYVRRAYTDEPSLRLARRQTEVARTEVRLAEADYLPRLSLTAGNALSRPISRTMTDLYNNAWNIGLNVSYPLSVLYKNRPKLNEVRRGVEVSLKQEEQREQDLRLEIRAAYLHHREALDRVEALKLSVRQAENDFHRYERLLREESVAEQQYEQVKATYEAARARYQALENQHRAARSQYEETTKKQTGAEAAILSREAALDLARLNLSYTVVTALYDGYMGRRALEPGQYVSAGQTLSYLVRSRDKWITANYRETQIANIYIGQPVRVKVDAFPGRVFNGRVTAISEATGSKYSLVPTDNSAGNFVKVQQRIPVRIDLEDVRPEEMGRLRAGMMVETEALKKSGGYGETGFAFAPVDAPMGGHRGVLCHHPARGYV